MGDNLNGFLCETMKYGYWFPLSLFEMLLMYLFVSFIYSNAAHKENLRLVSLVLIATTLWLSKYVLVDNHIYIKLTQWLSLWHTATYFPFFVLGYFVSQYQEQCEQLIENKKISMLLILSFILLSFLNISKNVGHWLERIPAGGGILALLLGSTGVVTFYLLFKKNSAILSNSSFVGRTLQIIGCRSMEIYLLHYFFLPDISAYGSFLLSLSSLRVCVVIIMALIVILFSLLMSDLIRLSPVLANYILGVKYN